MDREPVFASPDEVEAAYYDAFQRADIDAMMAVWAEADHIVCVHPVGGYRLCGWRQVLEGWINVFARELDVLIRLSDLSKTVNGSLAIHSGLENIVRSRQPEVRGQVVFTNIYEHTEAGWKMVLHHASPGPRPDVIGAPAGFAADYDPNRFH
jgi:ketosteroid isomerase-like protein